MKYGFDKYKFILYVQIMSAKLLSHRDEVQTFYWNLLEELYLVRTYNSGKRQDLICRTFSGVRVWKQASDVKSKEQLRTFTWGFWRKHVFSPCRCFDAFPLNLGTRTPERRGSIDRDNVVKNTGRASSTGITTWNLNQSSGWYTVNKTVLIWIILNLIPVCG